MASFTHIQRLIPVSIIHRLYLMEAEEVLDGRGCVEDVAFCRHHQHEAVESLHAKGGNFI